MTDVYAEREREVLIENDIFRIGRHKYGLYTFTVKTQMSSMPNYVYDTALYNKKMIVELLRDLSDHEVDIGLEGELFIAKEEKDGY